MDKYNQKNKSLKKVLIISAITVVVIILIGLIASFILHNSKKLADTTNSTDTTETTDTINDTNVNETTNNTNSEDDTILFKNEMISVYKKDNNFYASFNDDDYDNEIDLSMYDIKLTSIETVDFKLLDEDTDAYLLTINNEYFYLVSENVNILAVQSLGNTAYLNGTDGIDHDYCIDSSGSLIKVDDFTYMDKYLVIISDDGKHLDYYNEEGLYKQSEEYGEILDIVYTNIIVLKNEKYYLYDFKTNKYIILPISSYSGYYGYGYADEEHIGIFTKEDSTDGCVVYIYSYDTDLNLIEKAPSYNC
jgi:hypothetical protein